MKNKAFTLIETIVSIAGLSFVILFILNIGLQNEKLSTKNKNDNSFLELTTLVNKTINDNYENFMYSKYHIVDITKNDNDYLQYTYNESFKNYYSYRQVVPFLQTEDETIETGNTNVDILQDTIDENIFKRNFWSITDNSLKYIHNYNMIIVDKKSNYRGIDFLYNDVYVIDFNKLKLLKNLTREIKTCFFRYGYNDSTNPSTNLEGNNDNYYLNTTTDYIFGSDIDMDRKHSIFDNQDQEGYRNPNQKIDCKVRMENFLLENQYNTMFDNYNHSGSNFKNNQYLHITKKLINVNKVSNIKTIKLKIDNTLSKFQKIVNNLSTFNKIENLNNGFLNLSVNNFLTCYKVTPNCEWFTGTSPMTTSSLTTTINDEGIKVIYPNNTDIDGNLYKNLENQNIENMIIVIPRSSSNTLLSKLSSLLTGSDTGSTANATDIIDEITSESDIQISVKGFVPVQQNVITDPTKVNHIFQPSSNSNEPNSSFVLSNYKLFGTFIKNSGVESISKTPFYFTNTLNSSININNSNIGINETKKFTLRTSIKRTSPDKVIFNNGPYNSGLLIIFPWIRSINKIDELNNNFGIYYKKIN